jgi:MoaA/NifB/PqqE/SkfB family radical SAM enzyme
VQIEAAGAAMARALRVGDGEDAIARAEAAGLRTAARLCVRPRTFGIVAPLAERLRPREVVLEIARQDFVGPPQPIPAHAVDKVLRAADNVVFAAHRLRGAGYLPPCVLPEAWTARPAIWQKTFGPQQAPNTLLRACATCALADRCQFDDAGAPEVICTTPWTTMEIVDPNGRVRQCCSTWTSGDRGNVHASSLAGVWNGDGYRAARRVMSGGSTEALCNPICSRLHDHRYAERRFEIQRGSPRFVENQLLLAEDIAERREVVRGRPLYLAVCPSTYCNYDCIMCDYGRTRRRDLPDAIWDELPEYLPTLRQLTLLGGEPLANPHTWKFLRAFDAESYPDASLDLVTNGSLLTEAALAQIPRAALGDVTISLNAGTPEVYEAVQRGVSLDAVLANVDALMRYRAARPWWFGITLAFVVQPASAHTLLEFGAIAHARGLRVRLTALNPAHHDDLDFYRDPDAVARVLEHIDRFCAFAERARPEWLDEARAVRRALVEESAARQSHPAVAVRPRPSHGLLPVIG